MKLNRFFAAFLSLALSLSLLAFPAAAEEPVLPEDPDIQTKAALLIDRDSGTMVYGKNEHDELYPASLTKIMTALLTLEAIDSGKLSMDQQITVTASALEGLDADGSTAGLMVGEVLTVKNLMYCMMVVSANEACDILAEAISGSVEDFVELMNQRAKELGCKNTHFVNPNGLHDSKHYTSAWDLYLITEEALTHPDFLEICDTPSYTVPATNLSPERILRTTNYLIGSWYTAGYLYSGAHGVKTGSTSDAGHCLVATATRGSRSLLSVVLGGERLKLENNEIRTMSFYETRRLFDWGFDNFKYKTALTSLEMLDSVPVTLSQIDSVAVHAREDVELLMPKNLEPEDLERTLSLQESVEAPVTEGQEMGAVELSYDGKVYATVPLVALNDVEASKVLIFWANVQEFFSRPAVRVGLIAAGSLIVGLSLLNLIFSRRRYRYGRPARRSRGYRGRRH